jgi:hypothetical protein
MPAHAVSSSYARWPTNQSSIVAQVCWSLVMFPTPYRQFNQVVRDLVSRTILPGGYPARSAHALAQGLVPGPWYSLADPAAYNNRFDQSFIVLGYCRMHHDFHRGHPGTDREGATWANSRLESSWSDARRLAGKAP